MDEIEDGIPADYLIARFLENQGIPEAHLRLLGSASSDLKAFVHDKLAKIESRMNQAWFGPAPRPYVDQYDPWWTVLERELLVEVRAWFWDLGLPLVQKAYWPGDSDLALVVTHDVDSLHPFVMFSHRRLLAHSWQMLARISRHRLCRRDFERVARLDHTYSVPSTFFFMINYECISKSGLTTLLRYLRRLGFDIGLHGSRKCAHNLEALRKEKATLSAMAGCEITGVRQHELAFVPGQTWKIQVEAGLEYDSSFAWNATVGFRVGSALPFRPFHSSNAEALDFIEIPPTFMDWTLLQRRDRYGGAGEAMERLLDAAASVNGVLTVDFHNSYLNEITHGDVYESYLSLLAEAQARDAWLASAGTCAEWWKRRASTRIDITQNEDGLEIINQRQFPLRIWSPEMTSYLLTTDVATHLDI